MPVILTHPVIIKDRFHFHSVSNYGLTDEYNEVISRAAIEASSSVALKTASRNMPISLPRFLLCVTLSAICAQSFPGRLVDSSAGTESMADLVSSYFSECLVHIIEQSGEVDMDYGALQRPLMLHRLQKYRNPDEVQAIVAYIKRKGRLLRRGDSFRKFRCLVALVSTSDEDATLIGENNTNFGQFNPLFTVLDQSHVLGRFSEIERKMPSYLLFLYSWTNITAHSDQLRDDLFSYIVFNILGWISYLRSSLPPIFVFTNSIAQTSSGTPTVYDMGYIHTWYTESAENVDINCRNSQLLCIEQAITDYQVLTQNGKRVLWIIERGSTWRTPKRQDHCPFTLSPNASCLLAFLNAVSSFVFNGFNDSKLGAESTVYISDSWLPTFQCTQVGTVISIPVDIVLADTPSSRFRLITSDGVTNCNGSFGSFSVPFTWEVWILIATSVLLLSTLLSILSSMDFLRVAVPNVITVGSALIDQIGMIVGLRQHGTTMRLFNILWFCWLLGVIVITNSYKIVKSNYVLEPKFSTKWQRLEELKDFTVITAYEKPKDGFDFHMKTFNRPPLNSCMKKQEPGRQTCLTERGFWQSTCYYMDRGNQDVRSACAFFREIDSVFLFYMTPCEHSSCTLKYTQMLKRYAGIIDTATKYGRLHDVKDLEKVIRTDLVKPKTAFVSPENHFENVWKTFKRMMRQTGRSFAATKHTEGTNKWFSYE